MQRIFNSVKGKLFLVVGLLSAVAIVVGLLGLNKMSVINRQLTEIVDITSTKQMHAARSQQALLAMHRAEKNLILTTDEQGMDAHAASIDRFAKEVESGMAKLNELANDENKKLIAEFQQIFDRFTDVNKEIRALSRENSNHEAFILSSTVGHDLFEQLEEVMTELADRNAREMSELITRAREAAVDDTVRNILASVEEAAVRSLRNARVRGDMIAIQRVEKDFILAQDEKSMQAYATAMQNLESHIDDQMKLVEAGATDENRALVAKFVNLKNQWMANNDKVLALSQKNTNQRAHALSAEEGRELLNAAETTLAQIADNADEEMLAMDRDTDRIYATARLLVILTLVLGVAAGVLVSVLIVRGIVRTLAMITARTKQIADNDLTGEPLPVRSQDELGQLTDATNRMSESLRRVVGEVASSANEVASAATEIAASSEEMASGMNEQTGQVMQISSAIEQMSASIVEVARKSGEAANSANESGKIAEQGGEVVSQTVEGMQAINEAVSASATSVQELGKRGEQIGQIIEVIKDVADQTNLLALNAAIEAARAGEHGRGFAVVADEVRKLADRSAKATEEIASSIEAIQRETTGAVERMNSGTNQVRRGVELATGAGDSLKQIVTSAKDVAEMIQSIAAASEQQSSASEQVSRNVDSIKAVTQQASEGANQAASAASQLSSKAEQLQRLVDEFKLPETSRAA